MVGFGKHSSRKACLVSLAVMSVLFPALVTAASVGFYPGTFDPPTQAEIGIMRRALGHASVRKECAGIGKRIARLVVSVNPSHDEDTLASVRERALMVERALQKYSDLDIDLLTHSQIKQKLVIARNVYGDDANIIMET